MLDKLFANTKLSIAIPLLTALVVYLLFAVFGTAEDKINRLIASPIVMAIWFWGVFFILYIQVKNPSCPERFLNVFELLAVVFFGAFAIIDTVSFFISGCQNYNLSIGLGLITFSAISFVHSKREK